MQIYFTATSKWQTRIRRRKRDTKIFNLHHIKLHSKNVAVCKSGKVPSPRTNYLVFKPSSLQYYTSQPELVHSDFGLCSQFNISPPSTVLYQLGQAAIAFLSIHFPSNTSTAISGFSTSSIWWTHWHLEKPDFSEPLLHSDFCCLGVSQNLVSDFSLILQFFIPDSSLSFHNV